MAEEMATIHLFDAENEDTFPVYVSSPVVPRVGDRVHYWVDYPEHMTREQRGLAPVEPGEPRSLDGVVERVEIEYRVMDYNRGRRYVVTSASVFLREFTVKLYPEDPGPDLA